MKRSPDMRGDLAALILSVLALWRLPRALGLPEGSMVFAAHAVSLALAAALFLLLRHAFACRDRRLLRGAGILGLLFAAVTLVGEQLKEKGAFAAFSLLGMLDGLLSLALLWLVMGSGLLLVYEGAEKLSRPREQEGKESLFSRITGNGFFVFVLLLACWVPAWLAFWPGNFAYDSGTQFYTYWDGAHTTHHPLLHTLLLGFCISTGIDMDAEGSMAMGIALYSVVQMVLLAAMLAWACHWLRKRKAPLWARVGVTLLFALFPFYSLWSFCDQKDVLFGGLVLVLALQLADLWRDGFAALGVSKKRHALFRQLRVMFAAKPQTARSTGKAGGYESSQGSLQAPPTPPEGVFRQSGDGFAALRSPLRILFFVLTAALMMLLRNNGVYALCLLAPLALLWAKGARPRMALLLAGCVAVYLLANAGLVWATEAEGGSKVEMLSIPLQQMARTLRDHPDEALSPEEQELLDTLYPNGYTEFYTPEIADPVKWAIDYDALEENVGPLLSLWARLGLRHPGAYAEAFLVQNLPYLLPGAEMIYRFDLGVVQIDLFEIEEHCFFPGLRALLEGYDQSLTLFGLPGVRLLSDTAFQVWLCLAGLGLAWYRRQKGWMAAFGFLLAVWATCLLGPVALIRYMLGLFYAVPVLLAAMLAPGQKRAGVEAA